MGIFRDTTNGDTKDDATSSADTISTGAYKHTSWKQPQLSNKGEDSPDFVYTRGCPYKLAFANSWSRRKLFLQAKDSAGHNSCDMLCAARKSVKFALEIRSETMKMVDPETLQLWANPYTGVLQTSEIAVDVEIPANGAARYYGSIRAVGGGGLDVVVKEWTFAVENDPISLAVNTMAHNPHDPPNITVMMKKGLGPKPVEIVTRTTSAALVTDEIKAIVAAGTKVHIFTEDETVTVAAPPNNALLKPSCGAPVEYKLRMYDTRTGFALHGHEMAKEFFDGICCLKQNGEVDCKQVDC